ncbi:MAG: hypothetical protein PWR21_390 [Methanoculleus sp.]|nr:hypothetical protein [Methanoculleus sp.]
MLRLEDIREDTLISGIESNKPVRVVRAERVGDHAITLIYKTETGQLRERLVYRTEEQTLSFVEAGRPWSFDANAEDYKLAAEAYRIDLAYLFDPMMAVHTSTIEPLPHQISAVYESMLPRLPLRYVLADDPGAGKTIMAGLFIRELLMRADAQRILIVAPGGLVEQWQDELYEKFGLDFTIFSRELDQQSRSGNPFEEHPLLIARLDQLSRNEELQEKLRHVRWDLVVVDEAHKMSATYFGSKRSETLRFKLGRLLGSHTRHFLLMTATPHNGKEEDFQLFLSLLDSDRFYGRYRDGAHQVDVSDLMRRMVKEELVTFAGTPLFPERRASTVTYRLSDQETILYEAVTQYVREEMNKADRILDGARKGRVGFALTSLQRRLASSPEAIYQSLKRRRTRLQRRIEEERLALRGRSLADTLREEALQPVGWDNEDELTAEEYEEAEQKVVDQATASWTIAELEGEVRTLQRLEEQARQVVLSIEDRKWDELSRLLQETPEMRDAQGRQRKLIIFTEYRDTLNYLIKRIRSLLGSEEAVVTIHGGIRREERRKVQEIFRNDPYARVLVATDAAGEGVNLQNANLMVNYDLPWNPNRLEQRFGRIHRIGQTEVCHLWNMVASETREGDVFLRLFQKLENERQALGGRVFDILGRVFEEKSLRDLLIEAIRYGDDPEVRARLFRTVDVALDTSHLMAIIERDALCKEIMTEERLFAVKEEMEKAEARKLQPYFIRSFFTKAFGLLGGELRQREEGRWEIPHVPAMIRERDRQISGRERRNINPVLKRYERICFEKQYVRLLDRMGAPVASLIHPGHPLMQAVVDLILEAYRPTLTRGAVFVDPADTSTAPKVLLIIDHAVLEGGRPDRVISRRLQFVTLDEAGQAAHAGYAPHLDLKPIDPSAAAEVQEFLSAPWITEGLERRTLAYASERLVPDHFTEVRERRVREVDKTLAAVRERLVQEINYWSDRYVKLKDDIAAGKDVRLTLENVRRTIDELNERLKARTEELEAMRHVVPATPKIVGAAIIIPAGMLSEQREVAVTSVDAAARAHIEAVAMRAVREAEERRGCRVVDVSAENCGWDLTSIRYRSDDSIAEERHIEVKGRAKGQTTITVSRNEILYALNQGEKFVLAIVIVDGGHYEGPFYVRKPFSQEPDWAEVSKNLDLSALLARAELNASQGRIL